MSPKGPTFDIGRHLIEAEPIRSKGHERQINKSSAKQVATCSVFHKRIHIQNRTTIARQVIDHLMDAYRPE
jgi:hypothetical protein